MEAAFVLSRPPAGVQYIIWMVPIVLLVSAAAPLPCAAWAGTVLSEHAFDNLGPLQGRVQGGHQGLRFLQPHRPHLAAGHRHPRHCGGSGGGGGGGSLEQGRHTEIHGTLSEASVPSFQPCIHMACSAWWQARRRPRGCAAGGPTRPTHRPYTVHMHAQPRTTPARASPPFHSAELPDHR